jgi:hypothetical protein
MKLLIIEMCFDEDAAANFMEFITVSSREEYTPNTSDL